MKKIISVVVFILVLFSNAFADKLLIPFSCWPKELRQEFIKQGKKLDLSPIERTDDSWGYIVNEGNRFIIYTYKSVTQEDFEIIKEIIFKIELEKRGKK